MGQAKARLEEQLKASGAARGAVQGQVPAWKAASSKSKGVVDRSSGKQRPQQIQFKQPLRQNRDTWAASSGQSKAKVNADILSDAASTSTGGGFTSETEESGIDETGVNQNKISIELQVRRAGLR